MSRTLFRKYRPETFADFVGQAHIAETLKKAIATNSTADAYLFSGPRGTGKTSTARLLAKALLCEAPHDGEPDDSCAQCREISLGIHPDVYELDAASRTGVDNVREEIISRVAFAPIRGSYKVYIIDEVHMLSTAAFNALLKTLEEPPPHVKFVLCTTDPVKVPQTIQSRCMRFDFHRFNPDEIIGNLRRIAEAEGFSTEDAALAKIASHAQGGMRDAIVALEQIAVFGNGLVSMEAATAMLGQVRPEQLKGIAACIAARDLPGCLAIVAELSEAGTDIAQFTRELARYLRDLYVTMVLIDPTASEQALGIGEAELADFAELSHAFHDVDRLTAVLSLAAELIGDLKGSHDDRLALELALIRMSRPETDLSLEALSSRISLLEAMLEGGLGSVAVAFGPAPAAVAPLPAAAPAAPAAAAPLPAAEEAAPAAAAAPPAESGPAIDDDAATMPGDGQAAEAKPGSPYFNLRSNGDAQRIWSAVVGKLKADKQQRLLGLLDMTRATFDGSGLLIELPPSSGFTLMSLQQPDMRKLLEQAIEQVYGAPLALAYSRQGQDAQAQPAIATPMPVAAPEPAAAAPPPAAEPEPESAAAPAPAPAPPPDPGPGDPPLSPASDPFSPMSLLSRSFGSEVVLTSVIDEPEPGDKPQARPLDAENDTPSLLDGLG